MNIDILRTKSQSYQQTFAGTHGEKVLKDLKKFCMANEPTYVPGDSHATAFGEGRRDVWNRIMAHIHLTDEQLKRLGE